MYNIVVNNREIVTLLRNVAAALTIKSQNRFRIIAYDKAADSIEHLTCEVKDIWDEGRLEEIPGIGPTIAAHFDELFKTGRVKHFETVFKGISPAVFEFLLIPGIGPKRAHRLTQEFHLLEAKNAVSNLQKIAEAGKIAQLEGFGEKSQSEILAAIETYKRGQIKENRMNLPFADRLAQEVMAYLQQCKAVIRVDSLGSLRRKVATIGDIDLACATNEPQTVVDYFVKYPKMRKIVDKGEKGATILLSIGRQVDLRVAKPQTYGAMLQYFTGSKHHNIKLREFALKKGLSLSEHGIKNLKTGKIEAFASEKTFYQKLGMDWIPPEIREDAGEIEAALHGELPQLVETSDILGDLHVHSDYNLEPSHDLGASPLKDLLNTAVSLRYHYIGISDHNPSIGNHVENQIITLMKNRREKYEQIYSSWKVNVKNRVRLLYMLEIDILPTGKLALPQAGFEFIDAAIISVHSSFNLTKEKMTQRVLSAFSHPKAKILGHPTGRLLGEREGYELDWPKIFAFAKSHNKAIEINSWPQRLDLPDLLVRQAVKQGVKLVIDTDAHHQDHLHNMEYGVDVARRGWAQKGDILNTMEYNTFVNWLRS